MPSISEARLIRSASYFPVANVERSIDYYKNTLGFNCDYRGGDPPRFAICSRDGHAIMFREVPNMDLIVPVEKQGGTWDAFFWVQELESLNEELVSNGADIVYGPLFQDEYQMNEFAVRDSDGHVLGFGESAGVNN
jgi:catechol 2,3-dioxygenase-like lactoylglutathione lyase family enzyme